MKLNTASTVVFLATFSTAAAFTSPMQQGSTFVGGFGLKAVSPGTTFIDIHILR